MELLDYNSNAVLDADTPWDDDTVREVYNKALGVYEGGQKHGKGDEWRYRPRYSTTELDAGDAHIVFHNRRPVGTAALADERRATRMSAEGVAAPRIA